MEQINTILVVIDPTVERDFVADRARLLAKRTRAHVYLFINNANTLADRSYLYEGVSDQFFETQKKLFKEHYEKILQELQEEFESADIQVTSVFSQNHHLAESIINKAEELKPDLVLKSTHHHDTLQRTLISNTDWRLIRKCPVPLMLVKPDDWREQGCIVTAVDPLHSKAQQAQLDRKLVAEAKGLAGLLHMPTWIFHSYYPFVSTLFPMGGETAEHLQRIEDLHRSKVVELTRAAGIPDENIKLSQGDLVTELIKFLREKQANLLVIGALSRNIIERAVVGNTAERILEDCPCDILVLKT